MENEIVLPDTQTPDEEPLESLATPETVDASKLQELAEKNTRLFARAKKAEEAVREYRQKEKTAPAPVQTESSVATTPDEIETVLSLRSEGYTDAEVLSLRKYAKRMNVPIAELKNDPFIKAGIEAERAKAKVEQSTPAPSERGTISAAGKPLAELTEAEITANYQDLQAQAVERGRAKRAAGR